MIDAYVYAELRNMLKTADADAFGGYAYTSLISDKDFTLFSQALYPLLNEYFEAKNSGVAIGLRAEIVDQAREIKDLEMKVDYLVNENNRVGLATKEEYDDVADEKNNLYEETLTLTDEVLFHKAIIAALINYKG
jgi:hypothetical protein